ncbi:MAG: DUF2867 domain-containing protein [bacterium]|nr:DUF2867 domain-containing protein [bacterium]
MIQPIKLTPAPEPPHPSRPRPADYADGFALNLIVSSDISALTLEFLKSLPLWAARLVALRNYLVAWTGLKAQPIKRELDEADLVPGADLGLFTCYGCGPDEVLLGQKERHLDFYTSLKLVPLTGSSQLQVSTWVYFHNPWGRAYFFFVAPWHRWIVRSMLERLAHRLIR